MNDMFKRLGDALSASEGSAYITIGGRNRVFAEVEKFQSNLDKKVLEKKLLGSRITQHKVVGVSISGSMTLILTKGDLLDATQEYIKTGIFPNISVLVRNEDPASTYGVREVVYTGVIPTTDLISLLDGESEDVITYDTDFTADGIEILNNLS